MASNSSEHPQRAMIRKFIASFREQGFIGRNFDRQTNLHENRNSLSIFCSEAELKLDNVKKMLEMETVNYEHIGSIMESIWSSAARIGGLRVADTADEMRQVCISRQTEKLEPAKQALKKVTWEYYVLRDCFHHVLHAERIIHCKEEEDKE